MPKSKPSDISLFDAPNEAIASESVQSETAQIEADSPVKAKKSAPKKPRAPRKNPVVLRGADKPSRRVADSVVAPDISLLAGSDLGLRAPLPAQSEDYAIQTSQEVDALMRAASDGKSGQGWTTDENAATRSHGVPGARHHVQIALSDDERAQGVPLQVLEDLTVAQDPDFNFTLLYVSQLLAPSSPIPQNMAAVEWIDLDDVMSKIGFDPRSTKERLEMRRRVWRYLMFGARASIVGQRSGQYVDKRTGERIETVIDSPPWAILEKEKPAQPQLFPEIQETPLRVRLVASQAWTRLTTLPETAQYLPMGELLGAIPGNKPSGAWARVLGLALASFWRRQPRAALDGSLQPTRRELLDRYPPKTAPPSEVLNSKNPIRAIEYWQGALQVLVENGFLAKTGEAALSVAEMRARLPRQEWQSQWLKERVELSPGEKLQVSVEGCAKALPARKTRDLGAKSPKKRARKPTQKPPKNEG